MKTSTPTQVSNQAHTPGPWSIEGPSKGCEFPLVIGADGSEVAVVYSGGVHSDSGGQDAAMRNARAIRALPELLAAAKSLCNEVRGALAIGVADAIGRTNERCLGSRCHEMAALIDDVEREDAMTCVDCGKPIEIPTPDPFRCAKCRKGAK